MPVVNLTLPASMPAERQKTVSDGVHQALVDEFDTPSRGKFHVISPYDSENLLMDSEFLGVRRGDNFIFVQISVMSSRPDDRKRALLRRIRSNLLTMADIKPEDLFVNIIETPSANWFCLVQEGKN